MGFMQRFERSLETSTADAFARVFGGELTPLEVENALRREAGDKLQELPDGQLLSPNHFVVTLSPSDAERFAADEATSPRVVSRHLDTYLYDQDWGVVGDVVVEFKQSDDLRSGQFRLTSSCDDEVDARDIPGRIGGSAPASNVDRDEDNPVTRDGYGIERDWEGAAPDGADGSYAVAVLMDKADESRKFVVNPGQTLIGRGNDVDMRVADTGISRHHATIDWNGSVATISDLNSTNGTSVNGIRISQWQLDDGDEIVMGHTHLILRIQ